MHGTLLPNIEAQIFVNIDSKFWKIAGVYEMSSQECKNYQSYIMSTELAKRMKNTSARDPLLFSHVQSEIFHTNILHLQLIR